MWQSTDLRGIERTDQKSKARTIFTQIVPGRLGHPIYPIGPCMIPAPSRELQILAGLLSSDQPKEERHRSRKRSRTLRQHADTHAPWFTFVVQTTDISIYIHMHFSTLVVELPKTKPISSRRWTAGEKALHLYRSSAATLTRIENHCTAGTIRCRSAWSVQ